MTKAKRFLPLCLIPILIFAITDGFCGEAMQGQAQAYRDQGLILQKQGDLEGALAYYQKAILLNPRYATAYNDIGVILEAAGQPEEAKKMYIKATEVDPDYPNSYSNLALLYESQKDYTNAIIAWIKRSVLGGPNDPWAEVARRRLEDIARIYPEAYSEISEKYEKNLQRLGKEKISKEKSSIDEWQDYDPSISDTPY